MEVSGKQITANNRKEGRMPRLVGRVPLVQAKEGLMPQLIKKRRSSWALLVVGSLIASFLAVGATPVAAAEAITDGNMAENQSYKPSTSACVGAATESASDFSDVSDDNVHREAITCLKYYGVTQGTGDGSTYEPGAAVTRTQMARFIRRVAGVAGVNVTNVLGDFEDVANAGYEATQKDPSEEGYKADNYIQRHEMASLISRLLIEATGESSPYNVELDADTSKLKITVTSSDTEVLQDDFDYFEDSRNSVPRAVDSAISLLYELGVSNGRDIENGKVLYAPMGEVTRGSMASFILRALAHTSARPAGLSAQVDSSVNEVIVSARTERFQPQADVKFDVFTIATNRLDEAFRDNGSCSSSVGQLDDRATLCTIDVLDRATGEDGDDNFKVDIDTSGSTTVWVWTGARGARITQGADQEGLTQLTLTQQPLAATAEKAKVTSAYEGARHTSIHSSDEGTTVKVVPYYRTAFGESVDFTIQLVDENGDNAGPSKTEAQNDFVVTKSFYRAVANSGKVPAAGGLYVHDTSVVTAAQTAAAAVDFTNPGVTYIADTANPEGDANTPTAFTAGGLSSAQNNNAVRLIRTGPETVTVDAEGKATFSVTYEDLSETAGDQVLAVYTVTGGPGDVDLVGHDGGTLLQVILFTDAARTPTKASITVQGDNYSLLPGRVDAVEEVSVDVTVHDQFGAPVSGQRVELSDVNTPDVGAFPSARNNNSAGKLTIDYKPVGNTAVVQQLQAVVGGNALEDTTPFFWVEHIDRQVKADQALDNQAASSLGRIFSGNLDKNQLVVDINDELDGDNPSTADVTEDFYTGITPSLVTYADDHYFKVNGVTASLRDFENALATGLAALKEDPSLTYLRLGWENLDTKIPLWDLRSAQETITNIKVKQPPNADAAAAATTAAITATVNNAYDGYRVLRFAYRPTTTAWTSTNFDFDYKLLIPLNSGRLGHSHAFSDDRNLPIGSSLSAPGASEDNTSTDDGFILGDQASTNVIFTTYDSSIAGSDSVEGGFTAAASLATDALTAGIEYEFVFWLDGLFAPDTSGTTATDGGTEATFQDAALKAVQEGIANGTLQTVMYTTPAAP